MTTSVEPLVVQAEVLPGNGLQSSLVGAIGTTDTTLQIQGADAPNWPTSGLYRAVLCQDPVNGPFELVRVTGGQGTATLTIQRAVEVYNGDSVAHAWPAGTSISGVVTQAGLQAVIGSSGGGGGGGSNAVSVYEQQAVTGTTVTLPQVPQSVLDVAVNGQSLMATRDYTVSNAVITFIPALSADDVHVEYMAASFNAGVTPAHYETTLSVGQSAITLPVAPSGIPMVTRGGVIQYQTAGHYTVTGSTITLAVPIQTGEDGRISVDYTAGGFPTTQVFHEEFLPANGATSVTLSQAPSVIQTVFRDGVAQSVSDGHYSLSGAVLSFADSFDGLSRVVVTYVLAITVGAATTLQGFTASGPASPQPNTLVAVDATGKLPAAIMPNAAVLHEEFVPGAGATSVTLSQAPAVIGGVFRSGLIQSVADGHYAINGAVLTFTDAFDGLTRVVVSYTLGAVAGAATTVGGFSASAASAPQAGTLVATDPTTGKLPASVVPATANQLVNGGLELWQRGNGPYTANGVYTADRWMTQLAGTDTLSVSKDTTHQDAGSLACAAVTFGLGTGAGQTAFYQYCAAAEHQLAGRVISASARVRANAPNAVRLAVNGGSGYAYSNYHSGSGVYETLTVAGVMATSGAIYCTFWFYASCTAYIDNVTLVVGSTPADYVPLHPADDLARCLRYYEPGALKPTSFYGGAGQGASFAVWFRAWKAVAPTLTKVSAFSVSNGSAPGVGYNHQDGFYVTWSVTATGATSCGPSAAIDWTAEANP